MIGNLNIRDCFWDPNFLYYSLHRDTLFDITNFFQLEISRSTEFLPTRYSDNSQNLNLVLDLVFLQPNSTKKNNHHIHLDYRLTFDHASISVDISIAEEHIQTMKGVFARNSKEEDHFIEKLINFIKNLKTDSILNSNVLKGIVNSLTTNVDNIWHKYSRKVNIKNHSKAWWNNNCQKDLDKYRQSK